MPPNQDTDMQQANLEHLSALERRMNFTLPKAGILAEVDSRLKRLVRNTRIAGFRPGKAPIKMVARQHGAAVHQEVLGEALGQVFDAGVRQQNLRVAGTPNFQVIPPGADAEAYQIAATFEVYPEVQVGDLSDARIEKPQVSVGEEDVENTLEVLRKQRVIYKPAEREARTDDQVKMDFTGSIGGQPFAGGSAQGAYMVIGQGRFLKDFETAASGMKAGETKTFDLAFPADYPAKEVAGKTAQVSLTLIDVAAPELPALDADFARTLGVEDGDLDKLRTEVKTNLEREVTRRVKARVKAQVLQMLSERCKPDLPRALVQAETERLVEQAGKELASRGMANDPARLNAAMFQSQAEQRVRIGLVLTEIVRANKITAKHEDVRGLIDDYAQSFEQPDEVVAWYYGQQDRLQEAEAMALEEGVVAWVLEHAQVVDQPTPFQSFMGNQQS
jgi:trigger factor